MSNQAEAEKAINLFNGYSLGERAIKVSPRNPAKNLVQVVSAARAVTVETVVVRVVPVVDAIEQVVVAVNAGTKIIINQSKSIRTETEKENVR